MRSFFKYCGLFSILTIAIFPDSAASQELHPEVNQTMKEMSKPFLFEAEMRDDNPKFIFFQNAVRANAVAMCVQGSGIMSHDESLSAFERWLSNNNKINLSKAELSKMTISMQFFNAIEYILRRAGCNDLVSEDLGRQDSMRPYLAPYFKSGSK
jgi:hypothetical protein